MELDIFSKDRAVDKERVVTRILVAHCAVVTGADGAARINPSINLGHRFVNVDVATSDDDDLWDGTNICVAVTVATEEIKNV